MNVKERYRKEIVEEGLRPGSLTTEDYIKMLETQDRIMSLPCDDEILKASSKLNYGGGSQGWIQDAYRQGAKWMRDKIQGKKQ